ncbi:MAG: tetratricopeptide repeat protein [Chlamydiae bacterium]|nr:tetratricopeptide repeat protein [Chlamydiota bacterium]
MNDQVESFKENIEQNKFFPPTNPSANNQELSWEENARALGSLFAHDSYNNLQNQIHDYPELAQEIEDIHSKYAFTITGGYQGSSVAHPEIDRKFSTDYTSLYSNPGQEVDFNTLFYQVRGERALACGYYNQAVQDLGKAIETNPTNPIPYLERGVAHFGLGQYDHSLEDYRQFTAQAPVSRSDPLSISEFSLGVAKGLPKGICESGKGLFLFMADFVKHPIQTSGQIVNSISTLVDIVRKDEWGVVAEVISPEVHELVTQWDTLPSERKGELAGYAVGKHGADVLLPGALAKVASKSIKSAQDLAAICKNLQIAQETLVLETAAEIGNSAKIAEVVQNGQTMMALGEDIGLTAREMAQLKQAGKLEGVINSGLEKLVSQSESEVLKAAISQNKHVKMVRDYLDKPAREVKKGINSYEKQIALHKDKIANPAKHYPDWDKLDPRQREALINKKWPTEIQVYEEQRSVLQSILNERLYHE